MTAQPPNHILLVFAKAPEPGKVKTRIAAAIGAEAAADLYREMGKAVVESVRGGAYRTVVFYDPPEGLPVLRSWLGTDGIEFHPQPPGELGRRLVEGFDWGFRQGSAVCAIGTDAPGVDRTVVEAAFEALAEPGGPEAVFGPAQDGGYYLVALRRPLPELFEGIPWSTATVLDRSLERARSLGVRCTLLHTLADVDRPQDLPDALAPREP